MKKQGLLLLGEGIALCILRGFRIAIPCLFQLFLHIPCPGCGMTRAFQKIIRLQLLESFQYNILALPLFCLIIWMNILLIMDIILQRDFFLPFLQKLEKLYPLWGVLLIFSEIVNVYRGI